ncbi:MAG: hypothetical protein BGO98_25990 [Myxococcales bacterium 68-20]|nr:MAG: hypothetical protein BGO98_25990 [Myxococcales bacterium 68-20]
MFHRTVYGSLSAFVVVVLGASAVQCSSSSRDGYEAPPAPDAAPQQQLISPVDAAAEANVADGIDQECSGENKQIYVLTFDPDAIYRFDPASLTFALVGKLDCPYRPNSMAIDRRGYAWVNFRGSSGTVSGLVFNVRLSDPQVGTQTGGLLQCKEVVLNNVPTGGLRTFGMGFSKNDSSTGETLFVHPSNNLFRIDPMTRDVSRVGRTSFLGNAELTGTGDGKLFGYSPTNGVIARFDKTTGASLETYRTSAVNGGAYAFAHWGGDFWIFLRPLDGTTSTVYRYSPATDETTIAIEDTGLAIAGAGSSTCAPFKPVQ